MLADKIDRRTFIGAMGTGLMLASGSTPGPRAMPASEAVPASGAVSASGAVPASNVDRWRALFPALDQRVDGRPLAYLDSAATTQRPRAVIDAISRFYERDNANPGGDLHALARRAAARYGEARARVAHFLNATEPREVVFTRGTTEAINLVASTWGRAKVGAGDEILVTRAEHYSNLLPWRALARETGARVAVVDVDEDGRVNPTRVGEAFTARTKLVAFSHVSNVLGVVNPAEEICAVARARGVPVVVDAAQSAPHLPLDVQALGCDFLAFSGHKMLGPMGAGVLWARVSTLDGMPPYHLGGNMAHDVDDESARFEHGALKYHAGTPDVAAPVGLAAALDVLDEIGFDAVRRHDAALVEHARARFAAIPGLRVLGSMTATASRIPVFSFTLGDRPVADLVTALDREGIAVRGGELAAMPLLRRFGARAAVRASCYLYSTVGEIDRLADVLVREAAGGR